MRTWLRLLRIPWLLLCPWTPLLAAPGPEAAEPSAVFDSLEAAWGRGDVRGVVALLGERKVSIALPELEPAAGSFSPRQSRCILEAHFARHRVLQFQFLDRRPPDAGRPLAVALAIRRYRALGSGPVLQDRVLVMLVREESRWVLGEITALR
ncbi:MAG TPA: hypothetical protein VFE28_02150 [Candidatus Krumholzibacteria bacterium]|jgi:hypothetical protein|nr:hypothetical protein [Candidatus Krumholzibacteria bacterium]